MTDPRLSPQQWRVALLILDGHPRKAIAAELRISVNTVDRHIDDIIARLPDDPERARMARIAYWLRTWMRQRAAA